MIIISKQILGQNEKNPYYLKLNRKSSNLEVYKKVEERKLWDYYPIREDFDASRYVMYEIIKSIPCIFGGEGKTSTPSGIFQIEKVSPDEYVSGYHPQMERVKFFGYLVIFEDYFIHSDMYDVSADISNYERIEPISLHDEHTAGCIRVMQNEVKWLVENVEVGTIVEM